MALLLFSSAKGPDECMLAVAKAFGRFIQEAAQLQVDVNLLEQEPGERVNTFRSLLLSVEGDNSTILIQRWLGTIKWVGQSPYRPQHKRKNWFIGIARLAPVTIIDDDQVRYEATKASGAGGQHINKTLSAIRAVHITTGISVKVQSERSQHANKRLARLLLAHKLAELNQHYQQQHKILLHQLHQQVQRGEAKLVFYDEVFKAK